MAKQISLTLSGTGSLLAPLSHFQGEDAVITCTFSPASSLSGASLKFTAQNANTGVALFTKTVGSGITITDSTNGIFTVTIARADTSGLTLIAGSFGYAWDIQRTDAGNQTELAYGPYLLTRAAGG